MAKKQKVDKPQMIDKRMTTISAETQKMLQKFGIPKEKWSGYHKKFHNKERGWS